MPFTYVVNVYSDMSLSKGFSTFIFFLNSQCVNSKSGLNGTQYKGVKLGVGVESARLHRIVNSESL